MLWLRRSISSSYNGTFVLCISHFLNSPMSIPHEKPVPFIAHLQKSVARFPELQCRGNGVYCAACNVELYSNRVSKWRSHLNSARHRQNKEGSLPYSKFLYDFIFLLSACNIPQHVVDNKHLKALWKTYVPAWKLPSRSVLRYQLPRIKKMIEANIKSELKNKPLWFTMDERTDAKRNSVLHILVRILKTDGSSAPYLLCSTRITKVTPEVMASHFLAILQKFTVEPKQVRVLVTDGASLMLNAGRALKTRFPNVLHITCLLHTVHLVVETVRQRYLAVDALINKTKKVFLKSPKRVREFYKLCPGIPIPPQAIITRWGGKWLDAVLYYSKHFDKVKHAILTLNPQDTSAIKDSQEQFMNPQVATDVQVIAQRYAVISDCVKTLHDPALSLEQSITSMRTLEAALNQASDSVGRQAAEKLRSVLRKNPDYVAFPSDTDPHLKFANLTTIDAENSFSTYGDIFSDKRRNLAESTMESYLMLQFYNKSGDCLSTLLP